MEFFLPQRRKKMVPHAQDSQIQLALDQMIERSSLSSLVVIFDMDDQQSTPQSHKPIVSPSSQGNRFLRSRLPESTEIALLTFFSTARCGDAREFTRFCCDRNLVFGDPKGTKAQKNLQRTAVKNWRAYLSNNPRTLEACLVGRGLPVPSFIYRNSSSSRSLVVQSPPPDLSSLTTVLTPATPTKTLPTPSKSPIKKTLPPPSKDRGESA